MILMGNLANYMLASCLTVKCHVGYMWLDSLISRHVLNAKPVG